MLRLILLLIFSMSFLQSRAWGFYAHKKINYMAVFLLPPGLLSFYKPHIHYLSEHATDPDKRRYAIPEEGPRHYIDMDKYGDYPFDSLPRKWDDALKKFSEDSLQKHGIVPWWIQIMYYRLVKAFKEKNGTQVLKLSAELGHYLADAHVPLHTSSNHNGQLTSQRGIHGFWESRVPELLAEKEWDFLMPPAAYISQPLEFVWKRILESALAVDSVLFFERKLSDWIGTDQKYAYEERNGIMVRQYSSAFTIAYNKALNGMIERRMRQSVYAVASFWYSAWIDAGQPSPSHLMLHPVTDVEKKELEELDQAWAGNKILGREE